MTADQGQQRLGDLQELRLAEVAGTSFFVAASWYELGAFMVNDRDEKLLAGLCP